MPRAHHTYSESQKKSAISAARSSSIAKVAKSTGIPEGTLSSWMHETHTSLRGTLESSSGTDLKKEVTAPAKEIPLWKQPRPTNEQLGIGDESDTRDYDEKVAPRDEWASAVKQAISKGLISYADANANNYYGSSQESPEAEGGGWKPLPPVLYHVTTAHSKVKAEGLKSRKELGQGLGHGLGGGEDDTISFTDDPKMAHRIRDAMLELQQVARGNITADELIERAKHPKEGKPFLQDMMQYWDSDWKEGDPIPKGIQNLVSGVSQRKVHNTFEEGKSPLKPLSHEEAKQRWGDQVIPNVNSEADDPEDEDYAPGKYYSYGDPADDEEKIPNNIEFYKHFLYWQDIAGGPKDPLFFTSDTKALVNTDPKEIQVVKVHPKKNAQGYKLNALGEWRTGTGEAVEFADEQHGVKGHMEGEKSGSKEKD